MDVIEENLPLKIIECGMFIKPIHFFAHFHAIHRPNGFQLSPGLTHDNSGFHMPWTKPISVNYSGGIWPTLIFSLDYET